MADPIEQKPVEQLKKEADRAEGAVEKTAPEAPVTVTRPVRTYRAYLFFIYVILATVGFGALFVLARTTPYFAFDLTIEHALQSVTVPGFAGFMLLVSTLGFFPQGIILPILIVLYLFVVGLRWEAVMAAFSVAGVMLLGELVKAIVQRARPTPGLVNVFAPLNEYSFPSGHVLEYTAFLGFLMFLLFTLTPHSWVRNLGLIVLGALIVLVGFSRVYLGQHWPSDVLGAYLLGSLWLTLSVYLYRWGKPRFFTHQPAAPGKPTRSITVNK